jgi:hypothetical protein
VHQDVLTYQEYILSNCLNATREYRCWFLRTLGGVDLKTLLSWCPWLLAVRNSFPSHLNLKVCKISTVICGRIGHAYAGCSKVFHDGISGWTQVSRYR